MKSNDNHAELKPRPPLIAVLLGDTKAISDNIVSPHSDFGGDCCGCLVEIIGEERRFICNECGDVVPAEGRPARRDGYGVV